MQYLLCVAVVLISTTAMATVYRAEPGDDLQAKANALRPGDELVLADGIYPTACIDLKLLSNITIRADKVVPVTITIEAGQPVGHGGGVIFKSRGKPYALSGGKNITVRGITIDGCSNKIQNGAIKCRSGWVVEDVLVQNVDTVGITIDGGSEEVKWTRVVSQLNGYMGWGGGESRGIRITDCGTFRNNLGRSTNLFGDHGHLKDGKWYVDPQWEAGGGKFAICDDLVMDRVWAQGNNGPGVWFDYKNKNIVVRNSMSIRNIGVIHNYDSVGFHCEINDGPILLENCLTEGNDIGILPAEEHKLTVKDCHIADCVAFRNLGNAKEGWRNNGCQDITIAGNTLYEKAKIAFWDEGGNMTEEYREKNHIVTTPNRTGVAKPITWKGGSLRLPAAE